MVPTKPNTQPKKRLTRDLRGTRERLLQAAFQEIYTSGFRGASLDTILSAAQVTKGALYHHFASKEALGHAVLDEVIAEEGREKWQARLQRGSDDPITALIQAIQSTSLSAESVRGGCALNNLAQEMSPVDETFRKHISQHFHGWVSEIAKALRHGQKRRLVRNDVDPDEAAMYIVALYEGYLSLGKNFQDVSVLRSGIRNLVGYLESLRAPGSRTSGADAAPKARILSVP